MRDDITNLSPTGPTDMKTDFLTKVLYLGESVRAISTAKIFSSTDKN